MGGYAARLIIFSYFPCSADHERDWPPCKIVFFGLTTNTLNMRSSNNNNVHTLAFAFTVIVFTALLEGYRCSTTEH